VKKTARRTYWFSSEPEWYLYHDGVYAGYWSVYDKGPLPKEYTVENWPKVLTCRDDDPAPPKAA
jgi:hypothetical protein